MWLFGTPFSTLLQIVVDSLAVAILADDHPFTASLLKSFIAYNYRLQHARAPAQIQAFAARGGERSL